LTTGFVLLGVLSGFVLFGVTSGLVLFGVGVGVGVGFGVGVGLLCSLAYLLVGFIIPGIIYPPQ